MEIKTTYKQITNITQDKCLQKMSTIWYDCWLNEHFWCFLVLSDARFMNRFPPVSFFNESVYRFFGTLCIYCWNTKSVSVSLSLSFSVFHRELKNIQKKTQPNEKSLTEKIERDVKKICTSQEHTIYNGMFLIDYIRLCRSGALTIWWFH